MGLNEFAGYVAVAGAAPGLELLDLLGFGLRRDREDGIGRAGERRWLALHEPVDADHGLLAAFDRLDAPRVGFHKLLLHIAVLDGGDRAAQPLDVRQFLLRLALEPLDLFGDCGRAVENIAVFEQVRLVGENLLHTQRPLLVPWPRKAERFVPSGQLHRARAGAFGERHGQHLDENARDVVLRLLLGESERIDLHAVAKEPLLGIIDAVALGCDLVPQLGECAHFAQLGDKAQPGVDEERNAPDHLAEGAALDRTRRLHGVQHGDRGGERKGKFLYRGRTRFLQVIRAHVDRIPFRHLAGGEQDHVLGEPHGRRGRKHIGAAREVFLDDVVLCCALQLGARRALFVGDRDIEREHPRRGGVDGHRGVHFGERDVGEQRPHVAEMRDRHADLADLAARQHVV